MDLTSHDDHWHIVHTYVLLLPGIITALYQPNGKDVLWPSIAKLSGMPTLWPKRASHLFLEGTRHTNYRNQPNYKQNTVVDLWVKTLWWNALLFWQITDMSRFSSIKWLTFTSAAQTTQSFTEHTVTWCLAAAGRTNQQHTTAWCAQAQTQLMNLPQQMYSCQ